MLHTLPPCVVNGPDKAEDADVAVFAGKGKDNIYVQGEQKTTFPEDQMLDASNKERLGLTARVERCEAKLHNSRVNIVPPDPLPHVKSQ